MGTGSIARCCSGAAGQPSGKEIHVIAESIGTQNRHGEIFLGHPSQRSLVPLRFSSNQLKGALLDLSPIRSQQLSRIENLASSQIKLNLELDLWRCFESCLRKHPWESSQGAVFLGIAPRSILPATSSFDAQLS